MFPHYPESVVGFGPLKRREPALGALQKVSMHFPSVLVDVYDLIDINFVGVACCNEVVEG